MAFLFNVGALVIQLPSGSIPTISLCACWLIWRILVLRYASGIQSLGSSLVSESILFWKICSSSWTDMATEFNDQSYVNRLTPTLSTLRQAEDGEGETRKRCLLPYT